MEDIVRSELFKRIVKCRFETESWRHDLKAWRMIYQSMRASNQSPLPMRPPTRYWTGYAVGAYDDQEALAEELSDLHASHFGLVYSVMGNGEVECLLKCNSGIDAGKIAAKYSRGYRYGDFTRFTVTWQEVCQIPNSCGNIFTALATEFNFNYEAMPCSTS